MAAVEPCFAAAVNAGAALPLPRRNFIAELTARTQPALQESCKHVCNAAAVSARDPYGEEAYWEARYKQGEAVLYEWLVTWEDLKKCLSNRIAQQSRVLHAGCGNSALGVEVYQVGLAQRGVVNTDVSAAVIEQMELRFAAVQGVSWLVQDVTAMNHADASFDVVLDKVRAATCVLMTCLALKAALHRASTISATFQCVDSS
jgi:Methyltransferase domain